MTTAHPRGRNLEVRYGDLIGVADVSLEVPEGSIVALLGSNGAGKTTTLNAIAGLVPAGGGQIKLPGRDIAGQPAYAIVRRGWRCRPRAGGCLCSRASKTTSCWAPRRSPTSRASPDAGAGLCAVPEIGGAAQATGRHHVGRRTADAGGRTGPHERAQTAAAGRAQPRAWRRPSSRPCTRPSCACTRRA